MNEHDSGHDRSRHGEPTVDDMVLRVRELAGEGDVAAALRELHVFAANAADLETRAARFLAVGDVCERAEEYEAAARFFQAGLALEPRASVTCYFLHNNCAFNLNLLGRHAQAERHARRAIVEDPLRHNAYKNLGVALEGQHLWGEAAKAYSIAVRACPLDGRSLRHLEALAQGQREGVAAQFGDVDGLLDWLRGETAQALAAHRRSLAGNEAPGGA